MCEIRCHLTLMDNDFVCICEAMRQMLQCIGRETVHEMDVSLKNLLCTYKHNELDVPNR